LILRPQPGADESAERARRQGLDTRVAPLFVVSPIPWDKPDPRLFDAVVMTSANAARHGGRHLAGLSHLPCYAVGEATEAAARGAGFETIRTGPSDGISLVAQVAHDDVKTALHLCGRHHGRLVHPAVTLVEIPVYESRAAGQMPEAADAALREGALALLHSSRAAATFAKLCRQPRGPIALAAISEAAAAAAGSGWRHVAVAPEPRDDSLLELAAKLCQTDRE